jgi:hypothetical protein
LVHIPGPGKGSAAVREYRVTCYARPERNARREHDGVVRAASSGTMGVKPGGRAVRSLR